MAEEEQQKDTTEQPEAAAKRPARTRAQAAGTSKPAAAPRPRRAARPAAPKVADNASDAAPAGESLEQRPTGQVQRAKPRLEQRYLDEIRAALIREFGYASPMQTPRPTKVVLNMGLGEALTNAKALETAPAQMAAITGQHPVITKAKHSIAQFKIREGMPVGCMVTLRGRRMYEFLDRLMSLSLPRIRDFRGVSRTAFDGQGNYSLGLRDQTMFPELEYGSIDRARGLQVTVTTTARTDREGFRLLELMGMPFAREDQTR